ncbi:hypothetical protein TrVE_jg5281 [Triparma verrucosa]|uniref:EGF domain-specific O-linked N-acetylglucosamine transferase n=1 Tax=Triparma verrucosa TaxID=1606542 RepID=A0A9W7FMJ2_9STRA|nr:hypothetical protein TrVE_jg5281 [Triparma verrucosa]
MYSSTLTSTITTFLFYLLITFASTQQVPPSSPPILPTINVSNTFPSTPPTDIRWLIASRGDALDKILPEFCQNNNIPLSLCTRLCGRVIGFYNFYDCECPNFTSEAPENMLGRADEKFFLEEFDIDEASPSSAFPLYPMTCNGTLVEHGFADVGFQIPNCAMVESDFGNSYFDVVDQNFILAAHERNPAALPSDLGHESPAAQICRSILPGFSDLSTPVFRECMGSVTERILSQKFIPSHRECRFSTFRRLATHTTWSERNLLQPPTELPTSSVTYIPLFPESPTQSWVCKFTNLYYHRRKYYFVTPDGDDPSNEASLRTCHTSAVAMFTGAKNMEITVITESEFSYMARYHGLVTVNKPTVLMSRFKPESLGHVVQDNMIPLYWLTRVSNLNSYNLVFTDEEGYDTSLDLKTSTGPMPFDHWFELLKPDEVKYSDEMETLVCPPFVFCKFEYLYTGYKNLNLLSPHLSYSNLLKEGKLDNNEGVLNEEFDVTSKSLAERSKVLKGFRDFVVAANNFLLGSATDDFHLGTVSITIIQRFHSRQIKNLPEILEMLEAKYPQSQHNVNVNVNVKVVYLEDLTMSEQIQVLRSSSVIIAVEGGALDLSNFLRPNTKIVVIGRDESTKMPAGGRIGDRGGYISFWHEVTFYNWHDLDLGVYCMRQAGPGYGVNIKELDDRVGQALKSLEEGLEIERLRFNFRTSKDENRARYEAMDYFMLKGRFDDYDDVHSKIERVMKVDGDHGNDDRQGWIQDYANFFSLPGGHINTADNTTYVVTSPPPYYAVSHSHPSVPLLCSANPDVLYYNRVTLEHYVSYWTYARHKIAISLDDGLGFLGKDIAKNVIYTAARAANQVYLFKSNDYDDSEMMVPENVVVVGDGVELPKFTLFVGVGSERTLENLRKVELEEMSNVLVWEDTKEFNLQEIKFDVQEFLGVVEEKTARRPFDISGLLHEGEAFTFTSTFCGTKGVRPNGTVFQASAPFYRASKDVARDVNKIGEIVEGWTTPVDADLEHLGMRSFVEICELNSFRRTSDSQSTTGSIIMTSGSLQMKISPNDQAYRDCVTMSKVENSITPNVHSQVLGAEGGAWSACLSERLAGYTEWSNVWSLPRAVRSTGIERLKRVRTVLKEMKLEHRDIHDGNVLVSVENGDVKVIDFTWGMYVGDDGGWDLEASGLGDGPGKHFTFPNLAFRTDEEAIEAMLKFAEG